MPSSPDNGEKKCRFGNSPFALIYNVGRIVTFTREQFEAATHVARMCLCGKCDCCAVVAHVNKREETKPDPQKTALAVVIRHQNRPSGMAQ